MQNKNTSSKLTTKKQKTALANLKLKLAKQNYGSNNDKQKLAQNGHFPQSKFFV